MVPTLLLLVISTALAAPRIPQDSMEGSEDNSDNSVDYSGGSEDNSDNFSDNSGNYTDYLDGATPRASCPTRSSSRAVQGCGDVQFAEAPSSTRGSSSLLRTATTQCSLRCKSLWASTTCATAILRVPLTRAAS